MLCCTQGTELIIARNPFPKPVLKYAPNKLPRVRFSMFEQTPVPESQRTTFLPHTEQHSAGLRDLKPPIRRHFPAESCLLTLRVFISSTLEVFVPSPSERNSANDFPLYSNNENMRSAPARGLKMCGVAPTDSRFKIVPLTFQV